MATTTTIHKNVTYEVLEALEFLQEQSEEPGMRGLSQSDKSIVENISKQLVDQIAQTKLEAEKYVNLYKNIKPLEDEKNTLKAANEKLSRDLNAWRDAAIQFSLVCQDDLEYISEKDWSTLQKLSKRIIDATST